MTGFGPILDAPIQRHGDHFMLVSADLLVSLGRRQSPCLRCHIAARSQSFPAFLWVARVLGDHIQ